MYPKLSTAAVRDNYDDDNLSDIEDEVFIRDGKSGILKIDDDGADKRPLMPPRRKTKNMHNMDKHALPYKVLFAPFCYGTLAFIILIALIILGIFTINVFFSMPLNLIRNWFSRSVPTINIINNNETVACTFVTYEVVWKKTLPKFAAEAPLRSADVNGDNIEDIIVGFSIGLDMMDTVTKYVCTLYFEGQTPCLGGVIALDGETGETLWIHWTAHAIFSVDCGLDLTSDNTKDCIISGRGSILHAINGKDGSIIWEMSQKMPEGVNVYDAKFIADLDGDQVGDVVASHITQNEEVHVSKIILLSGKTGEKIQIVQLPESEQLFVAPQTLVHPDGENIFILATSSKKKSGGLYIVPLSNILQGEMKLRKLHHGPGKGVSLSPILADITSDGTEDIIAAMLSSTIIAFDGITFQQLWNYTVPNSEIISIPIPGYYNDDDIPDFMIKHQIGPGFPIYYYTVATILDGKTGKPLLEKPMEDTMSAQMSGLSLTVDKFGNDWFLHWSADCLNFEGAKEKYNFVEEQDTNTATRTDLCKLRFNSTLVTKLYAMSQHVEPPGIPLYSSEDWKSVEFYNFGDPRAEAERVMEQRADFVKNNVETEREEKVKEGHFYPRGSDDEYDPDITGNLNAAIKAAESELGLEDNWRDSNKVYDDNYDDRNIERPPINEIRSQRSDELLHPRLINSNTNKIKNKLDPNMDYTNGQSVSHKTSHALNETELEDYPALDESDFVDSEAEMQPVKRDIQETSYLDMEYERENLTEKSIKLERNVTNDLNNTTKNITDTSDSEISSLLEDAKLEKIFKRQSTMNLSTVNGNNHKRRRRESKKELMKGVQRQPPTGILLPSLAKRSVNGPNSMDLVFSTYWLPASEVPFVLLEQDMECIRNKKAQLVNEPEQRDEERIIRECLAKRGVDYNLYEESLDKENANIALGEMTIYRISIKCGCPEDMLPGQSCKNISSKQSWPAHLGKTGNGYFRPWRH